MAPQRLRRVILAAAGVAVLFAVTVAPSARVSDAAFTDPEYSAAQLIAAKLAPSVIVDTPLCRRPLLGRDVVTIRWRWPSSTHPYSTFTAANVRWKVGTTNNVAVTSTGPDSNGYYSTTFNGGLLGGLLGTNVPLEMRTITGNWTSTGVSKVVYYAPAVAGAATCTITNG